MKIGKPFFFLSVIALAAKPFAAQAQKVIDYPPKIVVVCMDADTRKPMCGVKVTIKREGILVKTFTTDGCGRCLILKPEPGDYSILALKPSYFMFTLAHVNVPSEQTVVLEIPMDEQPDKDKKGAGHQVAMLQ
jgi:hypothetical protein